MSPVGGNIVDGAGAIILQQLVDVSHFGDDFVKMFRSHRPARAQNPLRLATLLCHFRSTRSRPASLANKSAQEILLPPSSPESRARSRGSPKRVNGLSIVNWSAAQRASFFVPSRLLWRLTSI